MKVCGSGTRILHPLVSERFILLLKTEGWSMRPETSLGILGSRSLSLAMGLREGFL